MLEMKSKIIHIRNSVQNLTNRMDHVDQDLSLKTRFWNWNNQTTKIKLEDDISDLCDTLKRPNLWVVSIEEESSSKGTENIKEKT